MSFNKLYEPGVKTSGKGVLMQGENCGFKELRCLLSRTVNSEEQQTRKQKAE